MKSLTITGMTNFFNEFYPQKTGRFLGITQCLNPVRPQQYDIIVSSQSIAVNK